MGGGECKMAQKRALKLAKHEKWIRIQFSPNFLFIGAFPFFSRNDAHSERWMSLDCLARLGISLLCDELSKVLMHSKGKVQRAPQLVQFISLRLLAPPLCAVPRNKAPRIASSNSTSDSFPKTRRKKAESASPTQHEKHLFKKFEWSLFSILPQWIAESVCLSVFLHSV